MYISVCRSYMLIEMGRTRYFCCSSALKGPEALPNCRQGRRPGTDLGLPNSVTRKWIICSSKALFTAVGAPAASSIADTMMTRYLKAVPTITELPSFCMQSCMNSLSWCCPFALALLGSRNAGLNNFTRAAALCCHCVAVNVKDDPSPLCNGVSQILLQIRASLACSVMHKQDTG